MPHFFNLTRSLWRVALNESDVIFGKFDITEDYILINHILLLAKYYMYCRKDHNSVPSIAEGTNDVTKF